MSKVNDEGTNFGNCQLRVRVRFAGECVLPAVPVNSLVPRSVANCQLHFPDSLVLLAILITFDLTNHSGF